MAGITGIVIALLIVFVNISNMSKDSTIIFRGYNPLVKTLRTPPPRSFRVEIDISDDEYRNVRDINTLPEGIYEVEIRPVLDE